VAEGPALTARPAARDAPPRQDVPRWQALAVLAAGVLVVSTASILIRYAHQGGAGSLAIAALRLVFATVILTPYALPRCRAESATLDRRTVVLVLASGAVLALHFATWITSLEHTSVAASAVLVTTNPIWVGLAAWLWLGEPPGRRGIVGIALGIAGGVAVFLAESGPGTTSARPLLGNALALAGALAASAYLLIGRRVRKRISLTAYIWIAYASAAAVLLVVALASDQPLGGLPASTYGIIAALAVGPQLIGHTTVNWAIRQLPAPTVAMAILGEPIGAAILAWLLFGEAANALQLAGFALLLAGIHIAARADAGSSPDG
jgi:drug/metabolite transporter (DMT)-like permease